MIKYIALPNPSITMKHIYEARDIVDDTFAAGYFNIHLDEINCAWVRFRWRQSCWLGSDRSRV